MFADRNDCPHRRLVLIHSSESVMGSFCHSARFKAPILYSTVCWIDQPIQIDGMTVNSYIGTRLDATPPDMASVDFSVGEGEVPTLGTSPT